MGFQSVFSSSFCNTLENLLGTLMASIATGLGRFLKLSTAYLNDSSDNYRNA